MPFHPQLNLKHVKNIFVENIDKLGLEWKDIQKEAHIMDSVLATRSVK